MQNGKNILANKYYSNTAKLVHVCQSILSVTKYVYNKKERQTKHERRGNVKSYSIFSLSNFILCDVNKVK